MQIMKSNIIVLFLIVAFTESTFSQSVAINTTGSTSDPSAILDVSSTSKGVLISRMTLAQRNVISNPATGLLIWNIDCDEFQVYNGTIWKTTSGAAACTSPTPPNVKICNQTWMIKNLDVATYRNGDPIPNVTDAAAWTALTTGAYCYYNNDSATYAAIYGKLYNWYAVNDPRGLAPVGWHVPSDAEWNILTKCIDPLADTTCNSCNTAGGPMKETGTIHWLSPNTGATNSSGFTGLPGGNRFWTGPFTSFGGFGFWWSSTENGTSYAWYRYLDYSQSYIFRHFYSGNYGFSVRCVKD